MKDDREVSRNRSASVEVKIFDNIAYTIMLSNDPHCWCFLVLLSARLILLNDLWRLQVPLFLQMPNNDLHGILHTRLSTLDVNLWLQWLLVRRTDSRELWNLALPRLLIQSFRVPLLGHFYRNINPHLDKGHPTFTARPLRLVQRPCLIAISPVRADERRDGDGAAISKQLGNLSDTPDVLSPIVGAKSEVLVEAEADVVSIEAVGIQVVRLAEEGLFECDGDGGFAGGGEACEPDGETGLFAQAGADGSREGRWVEGYVAGMGY
jgi:hypothetical protein